MSAVIESHNHDDHHHGPAKGLTRWLYTTNHKDIGSLYLWFSFAMFLIGGAMALVIRAELFQPGMQIVEPEFPQPDAYTAWTNNGFWGCYASFCRFSKLACANDGGRSRYGAPTNE